MAFLETHVFSQALEVAVTVNVLLPEPSQGIGLEGVQNQEPPRVMYLLHGYSDDQSIWMRRTSVERYCASAEGWKACTLAKALLEQYEEGEHGD